MNIQVGQTWIGTSNNNFDIPFKVVKVTEKSVTVTFEQQLYYMDYPKQRRNTLSKQQMFDTMRLLREDL